MKVTNTDHTAINDNHSKCRMTHNFFLLAFIFLPLKSLFFCITWSLANLVISMQKSSFLCRLLHCFIAFS